MNNEQQRAALREQLTKSVIKVMGNNDLDNQQQIEVLAETFLNVLHLYGEFCGQEHPRFSIELLEQMIAQLDPKYAELQNLAMEMYLECEGEEQASMQPRKNEGSANRPHRVGRVVKPSPENSWLRVFPTPLTAAQLLRAICPHDDNGDEIYDQKHIAQKLQGVLLTSMPEADRRWIKAEMKLHGLTVVSGPKDHRLCYVVFGAGEQASTKTGIILDRLAHGEIIDGIYFEHFMDVLDELDDMAELHDANQYAQQAPDGYDPTMEDRERIANENGDAIDDLPPRDSQEGEADDLPF